MSIPSFLKKEAKISQKNEKNLLEILNMPIYFAKKYLGKFLILKEKKMKTKLFLIWIVISFFVYFYKSSVGGYKYRDEYQNSSYATGMVIGEAMRWPIDLFRDASADTSEVDGSSNKNFELSLIKIVRERQNYDDKTAYHAVFNALSYCSAIDYFSIYKNKPNKETLNQTIENLFNGKMDNDDLEALREKIRKRFDGDDFADILEEGYNCKQKLKKNFLL